ncbi:MAG: nuclear transport factor 2 family protein [Alphaproteobacteria bacterium]|nr:nuclear transport factor 2 family protein [Alphaproteobacteria bacterium]
MPTAPKPPFTAESAKAMVKFCEDSWNTRDAEIAAAGYTDDVRWRYREQFLEGKKAITDYLRARFKRAEGYRLKKTLGTFNGNAICARFISEWKDGESGQWYRTFGVEFWEFTPEGKMSLQEVSANDLRIEPSQRTL